MKNITRHTGTLEILARLPSSRYGNPRFQLRVDGFTCVTSPNSDLAYGLTNYDGKRVVATIGTHYGRATLHSLTSASSDVPQEVEQFLQKRKFPKLELTPEQVANLKRVLDEYDDKDRIYLCGQPSLSEENRNAIRAALTPFCTLSLWFSLHNGEEGYRFSKLHRRTLRKYWLKLLIKENT